ncbi:coniferyl aldehyde dehydrogenase [Lysobacter sp. CA199]|uniref:coniferyl aldehyde dehydrogenase n=1 Tax=Lysobacter sp. CA199 TaxID=3455608 RepID=UPI003F8D61E8
MDPYPSTPPGTPIADLAPILQTLRKAWFARRPDYAQRRDDLQRLRAALKARMDEMTQALDADFGGRSRHESLLGEGMTVFTEIDHILKHLRRWMRAQRRASGWRLWPAKAEVRYVPLGVVGVIAPWNYPVSLALVPLATAIAAGNHVYLKPSEHTPRTTEFLRSLLAQVFPPERVAVATGGGEVGAAFAALPLDHLFFTGSTAVGRKVMAAAARNLTPVTLELGGKSPAVIGMDAPMAQLVGRLATGKFYNAGQTCIAPDYVLVPQSRRDELVQALREEVARRYPHIDGSADYTRIINQAQYRRLRDYLDDARARGLEVIELAVPQDAARAEAERLLPPTLVLEPGDEAMIMGEEIFGPILVVKSYRDLDDAIAYINARDRPLALYHFSKNKAETEHLLANVVAGGVCVNETLFHYVCNDLPFGGVGASGMGAYHGREGFLSLSKAMPVLHQRGLPLSDKIKPPYRGLADRVVKLLVG